MTQKEKLLELLSDGKWHSNIEMRIKHIKKDITLPPKKGLKQGFIKFNL